MNAQVQTFKESDFKLKEIDMKANAETAKGNYNFLNNYIERKKEP